MDIRTGNALIMQTAKLLLEIGRPLFSTDEVTSFSEECGLSLSDGYAFLIAGAIGLAPDKEPDDREFLEKWLKPSLHLSDPAVYREDPYYKNVPFAGQTDGNWCYGRETIEPLELFAEGDMQLTKAGRVLPQLGFFTEKYEFPAVFENGTDWMSLAPNETVTLRAPIEEAEGSVLTYGLGLGYYVYMTARKPEVRSVTVIEKQESAIRLFQKYLLPHLEHPEKVRILCADALEYAASLTAGEYDCVFADIWRDAGDGMPLYQKLKSYEYRSPGTRFSYWISESMDLYLNDALWP